MSALLVALDGHAVVPVNANHYNSSKILLTAQTLVYCDTHNAQSKGTNETRRAYAALCTISSRKGAAINIPIELIPLHTITTGKYLRWFNLVSCS